MKYYDSPRWSGEILDCSMPMSFDTYSKCSYNCLYCFSVYQKKHLVDRPMTWVDVEKIKKLFSLDPKLGKTSYGQFYPYIKNKMVMQIGGLTDPFDEFERQHGVTLELLKFFKKINYPLRFSTKGTWWLNDDRYTKLFYKQKNWNVMFSIINLDPVKARLIEIGVDSPQERLKAIKQFVELKAGGSTLRLRPFILGMSDIDDDYLELIKRAYSEGADAISTEFFCLETRANEYLLNRYKQMSEALGFDIQKYYREHKSGTGYNRLSRCTKEKYMRKMQELCKRIGMRFYVSDAHFKELCQNGSCCGLPESWNYSRGQFTEALMIAKEKGSVRFSDISHYLEMYKNFKWKSAVGFNTNNSVDIVRRRNYTMFDWFRRIWNSPNSGKSPYKYFGGVLKPLMLDKQHNVIYKYCES